MIEATEILRVLQRYDKVARAVVEGHDSKELRLYTKITLQKSKATQEKYRQAIRKEEAQ